MAKLFFQPKYKIYYTNEQKKTWIDEKGGSTKDYPDLGRIDTANFMRCVYIIYNKKN